MIHCETPYFRHRFSLFSALHAPLLEHLEILSHDNVDEEIGVEDLTQRFFRSQGEPKFPLVKRLRLHDSTAEGWLDGADVVHISSALLSPAIPNTDTKRGTLAPGAWLRVKTILLDGLTLVSWKRCVGPPRRWMRVWGHEGEIVDRAPMGCQTADVNTHVINLKMLQIGRWCL
ncbi:hypothetical protein BDR03DRAFT_1015458 [Suillus americanus]|nr:hypothetical protein BDR03DRAFT_1015458 [Suillus americanus]